MSSEEKNRMGKTLACECGTALSFDFETTMVVKHVHVSARCPQCHTLLTLLWDVGTTREQPSEDGISSVFDDMDTAPISREKKETTEKSGMDMFEG